MNYKYHFTYTTNGEVKTALDSNEDFTFELTEGDSFLKAVIKPNKELTVNSFYVEREYSYGENAKFFANGFQSWTDTKEFSKHEKMPGLGLIGKSLYGKINGMDYVGDYTFVPQETEPGTFHSHGLAYVKEGKTIDFFGSMTDRTGYTVIYADMNNGTLRFSKDVEGVAISEPYELLNLFFMKGEYDEVFDAYFAAMDIKPLTTEKIKGYTSWYNYYEKINEEVILRDLDALSEYKDYVNIYQIDDGFETRVGDWFSIDPSKFPNGIKYIADSIHEKGFKAGIWLAPFGAHKKSELAKKHPDWLVRFPNGKPVPVGHNWGGFYALDIYNEDARNYIKSVFNEVLNVWGFDMVKLDFLYAASVIPMHGKSRGEIAYDSIDLLRECVGDKPILACGVQQMPCFGKVEYMRIGADMSLGWAHTLLRKNMHREDVSTPNALHNSIYRRCFNGRAFLCDPDVFLLRRTNIKFSKEQQKVLAQFIKLFGKVLLMSDNIAEYDSEQLRMFHHVLADDDTKLLAVNEEGDTVFIDYLEDGKEHTLKFCIKDGTIF
ncbi:MAG: alpha-galactosidase [Ruminococcaceae bacterium]|nr:alpha-galactosidase [Oscillospiraceae bacterium]